MTRVLPLKNTANLNWEIWVNEDFCRKKSNRTENGTVAFYNEFAKVYQLLIASPTAENSERLKKILESFEKQDKKIALLVAHGYSDCSGWGYQDRTFKPVQKWVDKLDNNENYSCLLIGACNPGRREVYSKNVPLIYAKGNLGYFADYSTVIFNPQLNLTEEYLRR